MPNGACDNDKIMYEEQWDYIVENVFKHSQFKATYVIETNNGKQLIFCPIQGIVSNAEKGDQIVKAKNSEIAFLIKSRGNFKDTISSRIFSPTCDNEIIKKK